MRRNATTLCLLLVGVMVMAAVPAWATPHNQIKFFLMNMGIQPQAQGKVLVVQNKALTMMTIKVTHMTPGVYDVVLNGAIVDTLQVNLDGKGKVSYKTSKKKAILALPYDPRGADVEIQASGAVLMAATIPATAAEAQAKIRISALLTNTGAGPGTALATFKSRFGRSQFEVILLDVAPGTYDVVVGGTATGQIVVSPSGLGELTFDSRPFSDDDDPGLAELLSVDPRGQLVEVSLGGVVMFSDTFPLS